MFLQGGTLISLIVHFKEKLIEAKDGCFSWKASFLQQRLK